MIIIDILKILSLNKLFLALNSLSIIILCRHSHYILILVECQRRIQKILYLQLAILLTGQRFNQF